ncbi:FMNH2-dependent dimethyl sulfone monooxygenase [Paraburkholderia silvatlantica]|uniref:FMNH2-dependent dimethyl sulfone monooxygenase n=1 Tax=Paraburkholderia silvatlantica TaxID=321895 RepID=A0A2V4TPX7_9BURK|nr:LLM class flavin-dependent oxidoreductase [Paraburkholderia silvatlantica]PYE13198.1 FMNH2-dependent dimethyl sulfone monooxygenase [Paraburkholderia silvatlantica]
MSISSPAGFPASPLSQALAQPLMLGLFLPIQSGGWSMSTLPRTTDWSFDYNARLTRTAEDLGFDLVFGLAQWLGKDGHGGTTRYRRESLDSFIAIASLAAVTKRILLVSTLHILYGNWHPLHLAKFGATLDHISGGRWGLNMVTGHSVDEAEMFGRDGHFEHDQRYEMASEFVDLMEQLWSLDDNLTFDGRWYRTRNAFVSPKPRFGRPVLVNATSSPAGIDYAAKHSDLIFITSSAGAQIDAALDVLPAHTAQVRAAAQAHGREVRTLINPTIVCRPTEHEASAYHDAILSHADFGAVDGFTGRRSDARAWKGHQREQRVLGGNIQIIGSPEHVVDDLLRLKAAGIDGVQLTFFDFEPDLAYFGEAVLPLLEQAGLRVLVRSAV